eukprot:TRINITY_DN75312_c0_g1_i1.p1 TRINITY_DN75312_c0_g1~~TRINITY_DN75312_c0_g1_i1.p1  ORF type:complete len:377 (-),score=51.43 TRINITY_DN75312_c0_g1_i1:75-1073(-)
MAATSPSALGAWPRRSQSLAAVSRPQSAPTPLSPQGRSTRHVATWLQSVGVAVTSAPAEIGGKKSTGGGITKVRRSYSIGGGIVGGISEKSGRSRDDPFEEFVRNCNVSGLGETRDSSLLDDDRKVKGSIKHLRMRSTMARLESQEACGSDVPLPAVAPTAAASLRRRRKTHTTSTSCTGARGGLWASLGGGTAEPRNPSWRFANEQLQALQRVMGKSQRDLLRLSNAAATATPGGAAARTRVVTAAAAAFVSPGSTPNNKGNKIRRAQAVSALVDTTEGRRFVERFRRSRESFESLNVTGEMPVESGCADLPKAVSIGHSRSRLCREGVLL